MVIALIVIIVLLLLFLLAVRGRSGRPELTELRRFHYAHRGLHGNGVPENSMAAFRAALEHGCGIELDIHLLKDGTLAVIHDSQLKRTTGAEGIIEDLTADDLTKYRLDGTEETIPTFQQVLELFDGKAPLIIELKPVKNQAALAEAACKALENYKGAYCMESFDPRCLLWLKKHRPEIIRGQLSQNFMKSDEKLSPVIKFLLTHSLLNFLTAPDFIAYRFEHRKSTPSVAICKNLWKMQCVGWTIRDKETHAAAQNEGWLSIFENFLP